MEALITYCELATDKSIDQLKDIWFVSTWVSAHFFPRLTRPIFDIVKLHLLVQPTLCNVLFRSL